MRILFLAAIGFLSTFSNPTWTCGNASDVEPQPEPPLTLDEFRATIDQSLIPMVGQNDKEPSIGQLISFNVSSASLRLGICKSRIEGRVFPHYGIRFLNANASFASHITEVDPGLGFDFGSLIPRLGELDENTQVIATDQHLNKFAGTVEFLFSNETVLVSHLIDNERKVFLWPKRKLEVAKEGEPVASYWAKIENAPQTDLDLFRQKMAEAKIPIISRSDATIRPGQLLCSCTKTECFVGVLRKTVTFPGGRPADRWRWQDKLELDTFGPHGEWAARHIIEVGSHGALVVQDHGIQPGMRVHGTDRNRKTYEGVVYFLFANGKTLVRHDIEGIANNGLYLVWDTATLSQIPGAGEDSEPVFW